MIRLVELIKKYHTTNPTILRIVNNHPELVTRKKKDVSNRRKERLSDETLKTIFQMLHDCKTNKEIGKYLDIPENTIGSIRRRTKYAKESQGYTWPSRASEYRDKQINADIERLYKEGIKTADIATQLGVSWSKVRSYVKKHMMQDK